MIAPMEKILVSACLLGEINNYRNESNDLPALHGIMEFYEVVPFCPEFEGGLPIPRHPSEQRGHMVYTDEGKNITKQFRDGAEKALSICSFLNIRLAILKEGSPSCGVHEIHDGTFTNRKIEGAGITAAKLKTSGIEVLNEAEGLELLERLKERKRLKEERRAQREPEEAAVEAKAKEPPKEGSKPVPEKEGKTRLDKDGEERWRAKGHESGRKKFGKGNKKSFSKNGKPSAHGEKKKDYGTRKPVTMNRFRHKRNPKEDGD